MLLDANGLPRYWATVWAALVAYHLEPATVSIKLRHIESLYHFADQLHGNGHLDDCLANIDIAKIGDLLEAYFICLRNRPDITSATENNWQTCFGFVKDTITRLSKNQPNQNHLAVIESKLHRLDSLYGQLRIQKSKRPDILRSLPASVVSAIYDIISPESPENPFRQIQTRWNAFLAFICMLHWGLRRGEALLLPVDAVKSAYDNGLVKTRYWINVVQTDEHIKNDLRYSKPSLKTADAIRQIPISEFTANLVQTYTENYRGKPPHPFLFNTQWDTPLSHESLTDYFRKITQALPSDAVKTLSDQSGKSAISPHDLRHTCAVVRLNQLLANGDSMDEALQKLRVFFGWARSSDMPRKYARAVFEDRLASVWSNIMDDRVEILRNIPRRQ